MGMEASKGQFSKAKKIYSLINIIYHGNEANTV